MAHRMPLKDIEFITRFAAFCRSKGDMIYDPTDPDSCALAQFGYPGVQASNLNGVPFAAFEAVFCSNGRILPRLHWCEFKVLADRLEALLIDAPMVEKVS